MVIIPTIGARGLYELDKPFDSQLEPNSEYTTQSIRYISEYISRNEDPYSDIYEPLQISRDIYLEDLKEGNPIVGLQSAKGVWLYVPARYILSWPSVNGVRYIKAMITADIGPFPADRDFSPLLEDIQLYIKHKIGITPKVDLVAISKPILVSFEQHERVTSARNNIVTDDRTSYCRMKTLTEENISHRQKIKALEEYILKHIGKPDPINPEIARWSRLQSACCMNHLGEGFDVYSRYAIWGNTKGLPNRKISK